MYASSRMARHHPASCKICGARAPWVHISATGLCLDHSKMRMTRNIISLRERSGPDFDAWLRGIAGGVVKASKHRAPLDGPVAQE
jgi:hypothetical protein